MDKMETTKTKNMNDNKDVIDNKELIDSTETMVRLISIDMTNFKNVDHGVIRFCNYRAAEQRGIIEKTDIMAIYGQNGSGKTALIETFLVLKNIMTGNRIPKDKYHLFHIGKDAYVKVEFLIHEEDKVYKVGYDYSIRLENETYAYIQEESIEVREFIEENRWTKVKKIEMSQDKEEALSLPKSSGSKTSVSKDSLIDLVVAKRFAKKSATSVLFNDEIYSILKASNYDYIPLSIISNLKQYANINLFIITVEQLGLVNLSNLIPLYFQIEDKVEVSSGDIPINLFDVSVIPEHYYDLIVNIKEQINVVLKAIIRGLEIDIETYGQEKLQNGTMGYRVEFVALRYNMKFPLKHESEGIKRIISILSALIAVYSKENVCLVVDEFDSGVFEYLLGQLLEILDLSSKGQFIFTSHNLRALEILPKDKIVFSTSNPTKRYMPIKGVGANNNLRDFYLRSVLLGGQDEIIYEDTNMIDLKRAFRKAGRSTYGK